MKKISKVTGHRVGGGDFRPRLVGTKNGRKFKGQRSDKTLVVGTKNVQNQGSISTKMPFLCRNFPNFRKNQGILPIFSDHPWSERVKMGKVKGQGTGQNLKSRGSRGTIFRSKSSWDIGKGGALPPFNKWEFRNFVLQKLSLAQNCKPSLYILVTSA